MFKITIADKILTGNMGDGWLDLGNGNKGVYWTMPYGGAFFDADDRIAEMVQIGKGHFVLEEKTGDCRKMEWDGSAGLHAIRNAKSILKQWWGGEKVR